jgi:hypothetical protein
MDVQDYLESLTRELHSLKNRVRNFIDNTHWLTDGEWKESVVRHFLQRNLPDSVGVGRGFIVEAGRSSHQIDILLHNRAKPVLFRDGNLVFVTPDTVVGIIEVKTKLSLSTFEESLASFCSDAELMRSYGSDGKFAALFSYEYDGRGNQHYLNILAETSDRDKMRLDFVALGKSAFLKYWELDPDKPKRPYYGWHSYQLNGIAPGYFLHNVVDAISPDSVFRNSEVWFPSEGKEPHKDGEIRAKWCREEYR